MKPRRLSKQHCRCRNKKACGRRFKGFPGTTKCPHCGGESRLDKWAAAKPWNDKLCGCDGVNKWESATFADSPHREGSPGCVGRPVPTVGTEYDAEYGF